MKPIKRSTAWKLHRGVIGPRTIYCTGLSSPEEYVAKAKALGLDFVIFLEDFAALKPSGFENLKADCRRLSTETFWPCPALLIRTPTATTSISLATRSSCLLPLLTDRTGKRFKVFTPGATVVYVGMQYSYTPAGL